jgi:hypothetical protein
LISLSLVAAHQVQKNTSCSVHPIHLLQGTEETQSLAKVFSFLVNIGERSHCSDTFPEKKAVKSTIINISIEAHTVTPAVR